MKGKYIKKIRRKLEIPALALIMAAVSTGVLAPAEVSAAVNNLPGTVREKAIEAWQPAGYVSSTATKAWLDAHNGHQTKNIACIATLDNHKDLRYDVEQLLSVPKLYALENTNSSVITKNVKNPQGILRGTQVNLDSGLYGNAGAYGNTNLVKSVLADTTQAKANRKALAKITETDLGLEGNLSSSYLVPLYVYYNIFDNARGILPLPSSLNDSISKQDFISLILSNNNFQQTNTEKEENIAESVNYMSEAFLDVQDGEGDKGVQNALKNSENHSSSKYQQAANTIYFLSNSSTGNFYSASDESKSNFSSSITHLEALYNLCSPQTGGGLYGGASSFFTQNSAKYEQYSTIRYYLQHKLKCSDADITITTKDFDAKKLALSNVIYNSSDAVSVDKLTSKDRIKCEDSTKSDNSKYDTRGGVAYAKTVKKVIGTKKVKVKKKKVKYYIKNWKWKKKVTYKTVYETKKVYSKKTRIKYAEVNYSDTTIKKMKKKLSSKFTDGSTYKIMSASELAKAKKDCNYYSLWATKGYQEAQSKLNAIAMKKKVLTPEAAARILRGYADGIFVTSKDGKLDLFSKTTYNDVLTWQSNWLSDRALTGN